MKVLFITPNDINGHFGGGVGSKRNYDMLVSIFGRNNITTIMVDELPNKTLFQKTAKFLSKLLTGYQYDLRELRSIDFSQYNYIFSDSSILGLFMKKIREQGYKGKIITYFHNCELKLYHELFDRSNILIKCSMINIAKRNEYASLKYSDNCIILNKRDLNDLKSEYKISFDYTIIPVSMEDSYKDSTSIEEKRKSELPIYTFLGSFFGPNIHGIKWFIQNVYPHVSIKLRIIGRDMWRLEKECNIDKNIEIVSDVPDLQPYILSSDYMVYPIFEGSGMKLKTCEALMYGKNIVATPEAFCGYDIERFDQIGACCTTRSEFIEAIQNLDLPRFNIFSRKLYLEKYSYQASLKLFKKIFSI